MPAEFQIIDGFEGLRRAFLEANPGRTLPSVANALARSEAPASPSAAAPSAPYATATGDALDLERALEAWARCALDLESDSPEARRRLRAVTRAAMAPAEPDASDRELGPLLARRPRAIQHARLARERLLELAGGDAVTNGARHGSSRVRLQPRPATAAAEAEAWAAILPGLDASRAWRFLAAVGRPVIPPEPHARRFLWRLGMIETPRLESAETAGATAAALETIARWTGFPPADLELLIRWHASADPALAGGGRCAARAPDCARCPFAASCAWLRMGRAAERTRSERADAAPLLASLRRRFDEKSPESLDDPEILALFLQGGTGEVEPLTLAEDLLRRFGGLEGLRRASPEELRRIKGVGEGRARQIRAAIELGRRVTAEPMRRGVSFTESGQVWKAFRDRYRHLPQEHFATILLDSRNRVIETCVVSRGTLNSSPSAPREVFRAAIRAAASGVILMHNHPSGDPTPSRDDLHATESLAAAGRVLGIRVLDHIILGHDAYYSFKDEGEL